MASVDVPGVWRDDARPWPAGVPSGTYGPRVHATVALCTGSYRLSKRTTQQVLDELFGVPMSVGTISQSEKTTTAVIAEPVEEARAYVEEQSVAHLDETSWREGVKRHTHEAKRWPLSQHQ